MQSSADPASRVSTPGGPLAVANSWPSLCFWPFCRLLAAERAERPQARQAADHARLRNASLIFFNSESISSALPTSNLVFIIRNPRLAMLHSVLLLRNVLMAIGERIVESCQCQIRQPTSAPTRGLAVAKRRRPARLVSAEARREQASALVRRGKLSRARPQASDSCTASADGAGARAFPRSQLFRWEILCHAPALFCQEVCVRARGKATHQKKYSRRNLNQLTEERRPGNCVVCALAIERHPDRSFQRRARSQALSGARLKRGVLFLRKSLLSSGGSHDFVGPGCRRGTLHNATRRGGRIERRHC